jgi:hypothetical protein
MQAIKETEFTPGYSPPIISIEPFTFRLCQAALYNYNPKCKPYKWNEMAGHLHRFGGRCGAFWYNGIPSDPEKEILLSLEKRKDCAKSAREASLKIGIE